MEVMGIMEQMALMEWLAPTEHPDRMDMNKDLAVHLEEPVLPVLLGGATQAVMEEMEVKEEPLTVLLLAVNPLMPLMVTADNPVLEQVVVSRDMAA